MPLSLLSILGIDQPTDYKLHAARWNGFDQPLDVFARDPGEWLGWNCWRGHRDDFNRRFVLSLIRFYPENEPTWLFGGIFEILARGEPGEFGYSIRRIERDADLIGRLKVRINLGRGRAFRLESCVPALEVTELLGTPYEGEPFSGYENVSLDFSQLLVIVRRDRADWKTALQNMKGIYLIVDRLTGKKYVGSAYGDVGIWSRWCSYVDTGHGWNQGLISHLNAGGGVDYARANFRMTLLETWPSRTDDQIIIRREGYWKNALLTRGDHGFNLN